MNEFTTKDTNIASHLEAVGYVSKTELVGKEVWFNFDKEASKEADLFLQSKVKLTKVIAGLIK
jgi:hypothetical protein